MRFLTSIAFAGIFTVVASQICQDDIARCHRIYCRFFQSVRNQCRRTCGMCSGPPPTTTTTTSTTTTTAGPAFDTWTPCSRSCDSGTRFRVRRCPLNDFERCPREFQDCNTQACPPRACGRNEEHRYKINSECCTLTQGNGQCGVQLDPDARIIGGAPAAQGQWPWMVRVELRVAGQTSICGGALLTSEWFVTAAHCVSSVNINQVFALVGFGTPSQAEITVDTIIIHPGYDLPLNDIAVVKLARPVDFGGFIQKICLPGGERTEVDKKCVIAGWGVTDNNNPVASPVLQEARLRILPYRVCTEAYQNQPFGSRLSQDLQICAGTISGIVDSCFGDSGGPIMCQRCSSCAWYMAGIVSVGPLTCGSPNEPGIYTKVIAYEQWIRQSVNGLQSGNFFCS